MIRRIVIAGGGTGGHLFPGIAVLEELRRRIPELEVVFIGTANGIEARVVPELGEELVCLKVRPLKGRTPIQLLRSLALVPVAMLQAVRELRKFRPDVVIGVGGYASGPAVAAAKMLGIPTCLLEQNAHVGLTNRLLGKVVSRAYLSFESTAALFRKTKVRLVGNPVRRAFVTQSQQALVDPEGFEARARKIFVVGGSQGAKSLNTIVPQALAEAGLDGAGFQIVHQTGRAMLEDVRRRYEELGISAEVTPFIHDMASAYSSAALVVCRAGATTVAELCAIGRASVLIPYPYAADDHQARNAEQLEEQGAAICVRESALTVDGLAREIESLVQDPNARRLMSEAARAIGRPDAAAAIADDLCGWLGGPTGKSDVPEGAELGADNGDTAELGHTPRMIGSKAAVGTWHRPRGLRGAGAYAPGVRSARRHWAAGGRSQRRPLVARPSSLE